VIRFTLAEINLLLVLIDGLSETERNHTDVRTARKKLLVWQKIRTQQETTKGVAKGTSGHLNEEYDNG
jgi:hypothetical protein